MNDQRPTRWPCSADSSRNAGPAPRSLRKAETGVSQSSRNVLADRHEVVLGGERAHLVERRARRRAAAPTQRRRPREHLLGVARARSRGRAAARRGGRARRRPPRPRARRSPRARRARPPRPPRGPSRRPAAGRRAAAPCRSRRAPTRARAAIVRSSAGSTSCGAGGSSSPRWKQVRSPVWHAGPGRLDQREQRVAVAVVADRPHRLGVARRRALVPQLGARAAPQVQLAGARASRRAPRRSCTRA